ncbi:MAG TPA: PD-(D/E)XK nuclease family protein, partial [Candidatus Dormibacteraeota bacterium]|nr:PD-(D/E)XK nuclease family protein [Candidatus Dormibacteraeota bacterium]
THASHYEGGRRWRPSRFLEEIRAAGANVVAEREVNATPVASVEAPAVDEHAPVQLSYSAIAAYQECPRQYWYRHVQHLPVVQSAEAVHGVILHEVLRRAGELRRAGKRISAAALRAIHDDVWRVTPFPDGRRAPAFKRNGAATLEAYRARGGFAGVPTYLEHPFEVGVDGWKLRGVIDRIDREADGWKIIDYKSGRPITRRKRDLQVALYALGASEAMQLQPLELEIVYLASGQSVAVEHASALVREAEERGTEVAEGIRSGRFPSRPERRRCRLCAYRLACVDAL